MSVGVVSALGRNIDLADGRSMLDMILTDAPMAGGASGGALLDDSGAVIGITTSIASDGPEAANAAGNTRAAGSGLTLATPIDAARDVAEQLITTGRVVHVWLGVEGADVDEATANRLGIDYGALVKHVAGGSPASAAGIAPGDIICTVAGTKVTRWTKLVTDPRSEAAPATSSFGACCAAAGRAQRPCKRRALLDSRGRYNALRQCATVAANASSWRRVGPSRSRMPAGWVSTHASSLVCEGRQPSARKRSLATTQGCTR